MEFGGTHGLLAAVGDDMDASAVSDGMDASAVGTEASAPAPSGHSSWAAISISACIQSGMKKQ